MERVTLPAVRDPVMSGLTMRDVVMESGEKIMSHIGDKFLANDIFTCVVDFDDIAPFCDIPGPEHWNQAGAKPGYDHWPRNMVNGFVTADSWKYVFSILIGKGEPTKWTMKLPREEEILEFSIALNTIYHKVTKINLLLDDDPKPVTLVTRPINDRQDFPIAPRKAKAITIELAEWEKSGSQEVIGVDNLWIRAKRPADFAQKVRPLLNIGALVKYPMGKGGVILNQLQIMPTETVPINAQKKQTIVSTILRNLGATFAGGRTLATGDLKLTPVPFEDQCNQYLTRDRGWFDPQRDLGHLPAGEQKLAGVTFVLRDFRTSPVPSCIMIAGPGVKGTMPKEFRGLKVGRKADALFFLHAFKRTGDWRPSKKDDAPPVVFKYVVHYSDGKSADVPVLYGDGADHWISKDPKGLKSAAVAWAGRFPGDDSGDQAVVYSMPWTNPRPDVEIVTIDLTYDQNVGGRYGVPAWLGLTAATAVK
jgi:beta-galactosidase